MRQLKKCLLLGLLLLIQVARADDEFPTLTEREAAPTFALMHEKGVAFLKKAVGPQRAGRILLSIKEMGFDYKVVAGCVGSFDKPGATQVALGLARDDSPSYLYVAFRDDAKPETLVEQTLHYGDRANLATRLGVDCMSWTSIERGNFNPQRLKGDPVPVERRSYLDGACVDQLVSDRGKMCYLFDKKKGEFVAGGGWAWD